MHRVPTVFSCRKYRQNKVDFLGPQQKISRYLSQSDLIHVQERYFQIFNGFWKCSIAALKQFSSVKGNK